MKTQLSFTQNPGQCRIQEQSNTHNQRNDQLQISPAILTGTRHFPQSLEDQTKPRRNLCPARSPGSKLSHPHTPQLSGISVTRSNRTGIKRNLCEVFKIKV